MNGRHIALGYGGFFPASPISECSSTFLADVHHSNIAKVRHYRRMDSSEIKAKAALADARRDALLDVIKESGCKSLNAWTSKYDLPYSTIRGWLAKRGTAHMLLDATYLDISKKTGISIDVLKGHSSMGESESEHFLSEMRDIYSTATPEEQLILRHSLDLVRALREKSREQ